jgi:HSP20 family molecular chaperone IbpA
LNSIKEEETKMGGYPSDYYVMPDHKIRLSEDRKEVWISQPLPMVKKNDLNIEVHKKGFCLDFNPEKKNPVHKCFNLAYEVDPDSASAEFKDGVLMIKANLSKVHEGKQVNID